MNLWQPCDPTSKKTVHNSRCISHASRFWTCSCMTDSVSIGGPTGSLDTEADRADNALVCHRGRIFPGTWPHRWISKMPSFRRTGSISLRTRCSHRVGSRSISGTQVCTARIEGGINFRNIHLRSGSHKQNLLAGEGLTDRPCTGRIWVLCSSCRCYDRWCTRQRQFKTIVCIGTRPTPVIYIHHNLSKFEGSMGNSNNTVSTVCIACSPCPESYISDTFQGN